MKRAWAARGGFMGWGQAPFRSYRRSGSNTNVFAFGIGSSVNRYLIEGVARTGRGEPFVVTQPEAAAAAAQRFRKYIESPILTDVRVHFQDFDAYDVEPTAQPDLFAARPIVVFGKWRGARRGSIELSARGPQGAFARSLKLAEVQSIDHAALPQLWARSRIARLSDFATDSGANEHEITALGLRYSLLTPYTSFVAVLEQVRNPGGAGVTSDVPVPLPLGMEELDEDCGAYAAGAEPELYWLLGATLLVLAYMHTRRTRRLELR